MDNEVHNLEVTYKYFDADFGSNWFTDKWVIDVNCKITKEHLPWIKGQIKSMSLHKKRYDNEIIITSVVCDGVTVHSRQIHTWC